MRNCIRVDFQIEKFRFGIGQRTKFEKIVAINEANELMVVEPF